MLVNTRTIRIEWGDCDPAGIVFFPRYFAFFDACTMSLFEVAGFPKQQLMKERDFAGFPMVDVSAKFHIPSRFGDEVAIESQIAEFGRSSFRVTHRIIRPEGLAVEGFEKRVWTGREADGSLKSRPIPQDIVSALQEEKAA